MESTQASGRKLPKPNNIVTVPTEMGLSFFKWWCVFLYPFVNLTNRERDVVASLLHQRWELSKTVTDPTIIDSVLMSELTRQKIVDEANITLSHLYVVISNLKKKNVIINNSINPRLVPNVREGDNGCFQLLILFKDK